MEFEEFVRALQTVTGYDLSIYKQRQITRILATLMSRAGVGRYEDYLEILRSSSEVLQDFKNRITINVSEFFRDARLFDDLRDNVLPLLPGEGQFCWVWSAGCATGEEPYSLALMLHHLFKGKGDFHIMATDIDQAAIEEARQGIYHRNQLKNVPPAMLETYFTRQQDGTHIVREEIKKRVTFKLHNLIHFFAYKGFDLVLCRNVVIYFTDEAKEQLYLNLNKALRDGGVLFLGATEQMLNYRVLGFKKLGIYFYQKVESPSLYRA